MDRSCGVRAGGVPGPYQADLFAAWAGAFPPQGLEHGHCPLLRTGMASKAQNIPNKKEQFSHSVYRVLLMDFSPATTDVFQGDLSCVLFLLKVKSGLTWPGWDGWDGICIYTYIAYHLLQYAK